MASLPRREDDRSALGVDPEHPHELRGTSRIDIVEGGLERSLQLVGECVDIVRERESGTLEYRFCVDASGRKAFVHERYRDSAAGLEHMRDIGPVMKRRSEVCSMTGEVCGTPSDELRDALMEAGVTVYAPATQAG